MQGLGSTHCDRIRNPLDDFSLLYRHDPSVHEELSKVAMRSPQLTALSHPPSTLWTAHANLAISKVPVTAASMTEPGDGAPSLQSSPVVTVGLPVFDGDAYVEETIISILGQEDVDLELLIADNGSTDGTEAICRRVAAADDRVRYLRSSANMGAAWNFNRLVGEARGRYFKWAAHDDVLEPSYLARCIAELEDDCSVSLAYPRVMDIDEAGVPRKRHPSFQYAGGHDPAQRARAILSSVTPCYEVFGVMRAHELATTGLIGPYASSDRTLLFEMGLRGRFVEVEDVLLRHRQHAARSVHLPLADRDSWFDPIRAGRLTMPRWRLVGAHAAAVLRAPLRPTQRAICLLRLCPWAARRWQGLAKDLIGSAAFLLGRIRR